MSLATAEAISVIPLAVAFGASMYISARLCHAVGLYLDGGKLGWMCVRYFLAGFVVLLVIQCILLALFGALPFQLEEELR